VHVLQAEQAHKLRDWTTGMVGYDAILSGLKEITRGPGGGSSSSADDSDSSCGHTSGYDSDSDTSGDAAAARKSAAKKGKKGKKQASKKQKGKKGSKGDDSSSKKTKKRKQGQDDDDAAAAGKAGKRSRTSKKAAALADSSSSDDSSSGSGSDSDGEPAAAATLAKVSRVKAATHVGRYAKRERAKTVRNYSASDLAAILGLPSSAPAVEGGEGADAWAAAAAAAAGGGNARQAGSSSSSGSDGSSSDSDSDSSSDSGRQGSEQRLRPGTPPGSDTPPSRSQQGFEADDGAAKPSAAPEADAAAANAWWRSLFVKSGGSGSSIGMRPAAKSINAHGFLEDDQTNLYMQVSGAR
jgi:Pin2-interacting protein X1